MRDNNRANNALRDLTIKPDIMKYAEGSAEVIWGNTKVICTASWEPKVPFWMKDEGRGWITAEYSMLPRCAPQRIRRDISRGTQASRSVEIQRLIGRAIRSNVDMEKMGTNSMTIDCDVIQADGGTRVASIVGGFVALVQAFRSIDIGEIPIKNYLGAVSLGIVDGTPMLDLCYEEDFKADADMNIVADSQGRIAEVQVTAEDTPFSKDRFDEMMALGLDGIKQVIEIEKRVLGPLI